MPDRLIRESALTSESLAHLSSFAERLFWRLTTVADDYGRFYGNVDVIRGRCMPLVEEATSRKIEAALAELSAVDVITLYQVDGKPYLYFPNWRKYQQTRALKSKFPDPPELASKCLQMPAIVPSSDEVRTAPYTDTYTSTNSSLPDPNQTAVVVTPTKRATRLPEPFELTEERVAIADDLGLDAAKVHEEFVDYWRGAPGHRGVKQDWDATWRNWCRRAAEQGGHARAAPLRDTSSAGMSFLKRRFQEAKERERERDNTNPGTNQGRLA